MSASPTLPCQPQCRAYLKENPLTHHRGNDSPGRIRNEYRPPPRRLAQTGYSALLLPRPTATQLGTRHCNWGYHTTFIHPFLRGFWGRDKAIPILGYQHQQIYDEVYSLCSKRDSISVIWPWQMKLLPTRSNNLRPSLSTPYPCKDTALLMTSVMANSRSMRRVPALLLLNAACSIITTPVLWMPWRHYNTCLLQLDASGKRYLVLAFGDHQPYLMGPAHVARAQETLPSSSPSWLSPGEAPWIWHALMPMQISYQISQQTSALLQKLPPKKLHGRLHPITRNDA